MPKVTVTRFSPVYCYKLQKKDTTDVFIYGAIKEVRMMSAGEIVQRYVGVIPGDTADICKTNVDNHVAQYHNTDAQGYDQEQIVGIRFDKLGSVQQQEIRTVIDNAGYILNPQEYTPFWAEEYHEDGSMCTGTIIFLGGLFGTIFGYLLHIGGVF